MSDNKKKYVSINFRSMRVVQAPSLASENPRETRPIIYSKEELDNYFDDYSNSYQFLDVVFACDLDLSDKNIEAKNVFGGAGVKLKVQNLNVSNIIKCDEIYADTISADAIHSNYVSANAIYYSTVCNAKVLSIKEEHKTSVKAKNISDKIIRKEN